MNKLFAFIEFSQLLRRFSGVVAFQVGAMLACHNYWHWAVYHIEKVNSSVLTEKCHAMSCNSIFCRLETRGTFLLSRYLV